MISSKFFKMVGITWGFVFLTLSAFLLYEKKDFVTPLAIAILGSLLFSSCFHLMKRIEKIEKKLSNPSPRFCNSLLYGLYHCLCQYYLSLHQPES